ncbi:MAG: hypothetical protein Fur0016_15630 [Anaerolineales bacterium]
MMYQKPASPFSVGVGVLLLFLMGLNAIDGEISGQFFGKRSVDGATYTSQGTFITIVGWVFIATAILLAMRGIFKR